MNLKHVVGTTSTSSHFCIGDAVESVPTRFMDREDLQALDAS